MRSKVRSRLTYANVMATIAVFVALGGSSYAAVVIVTGKNVRNSSLTGKDVKDRSLLSRDFKAGQLPRGAPGPKGDAGAKGDACSAADPACRGPQGDTGVQGPGAKAIAWTASPYIYGHPLATVGPWAISADCDGQGGTGVYLYVSGPGSVGYQVVRSTSDVATAEAKAKTAAIPGTLYVEDFSGSSPTGGNRQAAGTLMLHSGNTVAQVELHIRADQAPEPDVCSVHGTAIPAS